MSTPASRNQIPDESILDINGKQAYLGNAYKAPTGLVNGNTMTETPLILIQNGTANALPTAIAAFIQSIKLGCDTSTALATFKFYTASASISSGSAITPVNARPANANTSAMTVTKAPTVGTKGTLIDEIWTNGTVVLDSELLVLDSGQSLLITQQVSASADVQATLGWYER